MKRLHGMLVAASLIVPAGLALAGDTAATGPRKPTAAARQEYARHDAKAERQARQAIVDMEKADPGINAFRHGSAGYAVFATVGKAGLGLGGAHGTGVLFEEGMAIGSVSLTQLTIGLQAGGQAYSEIVFFENEKTMAAFKRGDFALAAQVSAVALASGASANARYVDGVTVFTLARGGLMAEASVGGQKFGFLPFKDMVITGAR
jgi:lipid-binding SYLF domain-containing protein